MCYYDVYLAELDITPDGKAYYRFIYKIDTKYSLNEIEQEIDFAYEKNKNEIYVVVPRFQL